MSMLGTMIDDWESLLSLMVRNRHVAEDTARLAPEVRDAAGGAGLWVLAAPKEAGGLELPLPDLFRLFERLGEADPTVAWHAVNSLPAGLAGAHLSEADRAVVFARTDRPYAFSGTVVADVRATPAAGGFMLGGTWPFLTGVLDAEWAAVTVRVVQSDGSPPPGPPDVRRFLLPLSEVQVHDTWSEATGMRGTGSHAASAHEVFVPDSRAISLAAAPAIDRPLFRVSGILHFMGPVAAMAVGILRSCTSAVVELTANKRSRVDGHGHFDDPRVQQTVADATAAAACLSAGLAEVVERYWAAHVDGEEPGVETRALLWSILFNTLDVVRRHVSDLYAVGTSATFSTRNPVDRALRDIHAFNAAFDSFQSLRRAAGRALLGHDPKHVLF